VDVDTDNIRVKTLLGLLLSVKVVPGRLDYCIVPRLMSVTICSALL